MKKVLIGSRAAYDYFGDDYYRNIENSDYDYLVNLPENEFEQIRKESIYHTDGHRAEYHNCNSYKGLEHFYENSGEIAIPEFLYTLKVSHCFWNVNWPKTMDDILFFQSRGVSLCDDLFFLLYNDWVQIHGDKRAYLDKTNDEFFKDGVNRVYSHDDIHLAIAYYDRPLYEKCKKDLNKAILSYDLFLQLSYTDQLKLCREEIYATALERFIIPSNFRCNSRVVYKGACRLLLTSMTKGWFPKFIALNWLQLHKPDPNFSYVTIFKERINYVGKVKC